MTIKTQPTPKEAQTITLGELWDRPFKTREDLVTPWLRQGESCMVWAAPGVGKTLLTLTLALLVAGGGEVAGWSAVTPRKVLLVDGEMNAEDLKDRLMMLAGAVAGIDLEKARDNLVILPRTLQADTVSFPDLGEKELPEGARRKHAGQDYVFAKARECHAELVILDNFSTLVSVADENDAAAMKTTTDFLMRLKTGGIGCILVHHSGKAGNSYRGSSMLATTFEVIIGLKALEDQIGIGVGGAAFELHWEKYRRKPHESVRPRTMTLEEVEEVSRWTVAASETTEIRQLVNAVESEMFGSQKALAQSLGWDEAKVSRTKGKAIKAGEITPGHWKTCMSGGDDGGCQDF